MPSAADGSIASGVMIPNMSSFSRFHDHDDHTIKGNEIALANPRCTAAPTTARRRELSMVYSYLFLLQCCLLFMVSSVEAASIIQSAAVDTNGDSSNDNMETGSSFPVNNLAPIILEGIELPVQRKLDGKTLYRNGHGIRSFNFYGLRMKMYVASLYSQFPLRNEEDILSCECPLLFHFIFLKGVSQGKVKLAWQKQLEWSVSHIYDGYERDRDAFVNMFGPMEHRGTVTIKIDGNQTLVLDQDKVKGSIQGLNFQRAFLTMWFGDRAVADDLKLALLGNSSQQA